MDFPAAIYSGAFAVIVLGCTSVRLTESANSMWEVCCGLKSELPYHNWLHHYFKIEAYFQAYFICWLAYRCGSRKLRLAINLAIYIQLSILRINQKTY